MPLTQREQARYARHVQLPEIGTSGQERLKAASVLVVGAGGLGAPALLYLAAAGIGRLGLIDDDVIDRSNLQRQIIYSDSQTGQSKALTAAEQLRAQNPDIEIIAYPERLTAANINEIFALFDVIINGADNFPTRYLVSDACVLLKKPHIHGAIHRFEGEVSVFLGDQKHPCYRCLHPEPPALGSVPSCGEAGVLGVLPGIIGVLQATEAIKLLLNIGTPLIGRLLLFDALSLRFRELTLRRNALCASCGNAPTITEIVESVEACATKSSVAIESSMIEITPTELHQKLENADSFVLLDVREPSEFAFCRILGAQNIPLASVPARQQELDPDAEIIVMCRSGRRSADALLFLQQQGFTNLKNLKGGILAWSDEVDPSMPKY
jgi:sulfur-carrier protein adenylyltransferase/sulfurtransferase